MKTHAIWVKANILKLLVIVLLLSHLLNTFLDVWIWFLLYLLQTSRRGDGCGDSAQEV